MISKKLQEKLDYYNEAYCSLDKPIPFKGEIILHPLTVDHYYEFYSCLPCITQDKSIKYVLDERGRKKKVANTEGLSKSYLGYLFSQMKDEQIGPQITEQFIHLMEMVTGVQRGMYCPSCKKEHSYGEVFKGMDDFVAEHSKIMIDGLNQRMRDSGLDPEKAPLSDAIIQKIKIKCTNDFITQQMICPECGGQFRETYSLKDDKKKQTLVIKDTEITSREFDELKAIIPRQNILDYDGDKYIDPDLKEELEIKARLKNEDYTSPSLEKQMICVAIGTGYTLEYIKTLTIRKLSLFLRTIDRKETYYSQLQASMSGFVKFEHDPKHWIFSDDTRKISDELTDYSTFEKKFKDVV